MKKNGNPYPKSIVDECSGIRVPSIMHATWAEGYEAGRKDGRPNKGEQAGRLR